MADTPPVAPQPSRVVQLGLRIDCEKQGCKPRHADDGEIMPVQRWRKTINGHAATRVTRTITTTPWTEQSAPGQPSDPVNEWSLTPEQQATFDATDCSCEHAPRHSTSCAKWRAVIEPNIVAR